MFLKKLLYITTNLQGSGGVSRILSVKLNYLIEKFNYKIYVINSNQSNKDFFYDFNDQIKFYQFTSKQLFKYKRKLNTLISNIKPDIIINCDNGLKGALIPYLINTKIALIYEMHSSKDMIFDKFSDRLKFKISNYLVQKNINAYRYFVVLTKNHSKEWKGNNIQVINNPITITTLDINKRKQKTVLAIGRFSPEKGYSRLLKIWSKIALENPNWKLEIYGAGKKYKYVNLLKKLQILDRVILNEPVKNVEKIYAKASFLVNVSFSEAFPLSMIEGMYSGLPVIAYKTIGSKQLILNNENGFLIAQNDEISFVEKIKKLINDEEKLIEMSIKAINSVKKYELDFIMEQWHELFESLN